MHNLLHRIIPTSSGGPATLFLSATACLWLASPGSLRATVTASQSSGHLSFGLGADSDSLFLTPTGPTALVANGTGLGAAPYSGVNAGISFNFQGDAQFLQTILGAHPAYGPLTVSSSASASHIYVDDENTGGVGNSFDFSGFVSSGQYASAGPADTIIATKSANFKLAQSYLLADDGMSLGLSNITTAILTETSGDHTFVFTSWVGTLNLTNQSGSTLTVVGTPQDPTSLSPTSVVTNNGTLTLGDNFAMYDTDITGGGTIVNNGSLVVNEGGGLTIGIIISGTGSLTQEGTGTLILSGANTYTGGTTVNSVLSVSSLANGGTASNIGKSTNAAANLVIDGGTLSYTGSAVSTARLFTVGMNGATLDASGTGAIKFTGTGSLAMGGTASARTLTLTGTNTGTNSLAAVVSDSGTGVNITSVTKAGAGTWQLSGTSANTYTGLTSVTGGELDLNKTAGVNAIRGDVTVSGGTLKWLASNQVANTSHVTLSSGTMDLNGQTETVSTFTNSGGTFTTGAGHLIGTGATITWSGGTNTVNNGGVMEDAHIVITGGTNTVEGGATGGVLQLNFGGAGLEITGANLTLNSDNAVAGKLVLNGDVTSHASATTSTISSGGSAANPGLIDLGNNGLRQFRIENGAAASDLTIGAVITNGDLDMEGMGTTTSTMTLNGANTYTGITYIYNGTLSVPLLANGGMASGIGQSDNSAGNLQLNAAILRYTGPAVSTDRLFTIAENGGTLDASGSGAVNFTSTGSIVMGGNNGARTLGLTGTNTDANTLAAKIGDQTSSFKTSVTKSGPGTWVLSGANTYTGVTTISGGTLSVSSLANGGTASNIGQSTNAAANLVIDGTLSYTGSAVSTARLFTVGMNGATLDASGTGAIKFTGTGSLAMGSTASARTLTLTGTNTGTNSLAAVVSDSGTGVNITSVTKAGAGTWQLSGTSANTYTGLTSVTGGELDLNKTAGVNAIGGDVTVNGGTLKWLADNQVANASNVVLSSGALDLNGHTETVTTFTNSGGTFSTGPGHLIGTGATITWSGGTNTVNDGGLMEDAHIVISGGTNTVEGGATGGVLKLDSGGAGLEITGANLTVNSDNTVAGKLLLNGDVTSHASATTSTISSGLSNTNPGQIDLGGATRTFTVEDGAATSDLTLGASIANGGVTKSGLGTMTIDGIATYTGATTINAGTLAIGDSGDISTSSGVNLTMAGATFDVSQATGPVIQDLTGVAGTSVQLGANILTLGTANSTTFAGVLEDEGIMGAIAKQGTGTLTLTGTNTYVCETFINEGTLAIGAGGSIATSCEVDIADGATFDITNGGNQTIKDLFAYAGGLIELGENTLTVGTDNDSFSDGTIEGTGGLVKQGTGALTLDGSQTYTGATHVNEGTLRADADNVFASASAHTVLSGAFIDLNDHNETIASLAGAGKVLLGSGTLTTGGNNTSTTFSGKITGTGGVTKTGTGTFTITGANSYGGPTIIAQGTLQLGAADALSTSTAIQLTGGTFDLNGYSPEAFTSALTVAGAGSTLDFGLGHIGGVTVEFGDSSAVTWTFDVTLLHFTVDTDELGFTLPGGLTSTQLAGINLEGYTAIGIDANGFVEFEVAPVPEPTVALIIPAFLGVIGFVYWRRRQETV